MIKFLDQARQVTPYGVLLPVVPVHWVLHSGTVLFFFVPADLRTVCRS
eukprot:SAG11_NODE_1527_length_4740_cov_20.044172_4_plen_48_part_00